MTARGRGFEAARALYAENGRVAQVFWEWRHKVMLLATLTLGGVLGIAAWMYRHDLETAASIPFVVGALIFDLCRRFDRRIAQVLGQCYERGQILETRLARFDQLLGETPWIYGQFAVRATGHATSLALDPPPQSFTRSLRWTYLLLALSSLAMGIVIVVAGVYEANWLRP